MRTLLLSLVALAGMSLTNAHAAPVATRLDAPAMAAVSGVQRVDYNDWRRREWRRREEERRWHRRREWRERGVYRRY